MAKGNAAMSVQGGAPVDFLTGIFVDPDELLAHEPEELAPIVLHLLCMRGRAV